MARPDQVTLGVLISQVSREEVDAAIAVCRVKEKRSDGKLPAHVTAYLTLALTLFPDDDYTEVATKVTGSLDRFGCWDAAWTVPTSSAITQARKRLGRNVFAEIFERCCGPVAGPAGPTAEMAALGTARGAFLRGWRVLGIDGFEVDVPDSDDNIAEFGYAGSGDNRSAFPKARTVALAECGTHAFVAAEIGPYATGEKTLAAGLYPRLRPDELLTADRGFYSWDAWDSASATGAALLWRAPTQLDLPVVKVCNDGTYLTALIKPTVRGRRRALLLQAARAAAARGIDLHDPHRLRRHPTSVRRQGPPRDPPGPRRRVRRARPDRQRHRRTDRPAEHDPATPPTPAPTSWPPPTTSDGRKKPRTTNSRPTSAGPGGSCDPGCPTWSTKRSGPT